MTDTLGALRRLTGRRSRVDDEWRATVKAAVAEGHSLRKVGEAAGVSHVRVLQITRE